MMEKTLKILGIVLFVLVAYYYYMFSKTSWGGWRPPSAALKLTHLEEKWLEKNNAYYNCEIEYIGLDDSYREDSVIYINILYSNTNNSLLFRKLNSNIESITKSISESFLTSSLNKRKQKYIYITYEKQNFEKEILDNTISFYRSCMFDLKTKKVFPTKKHLIVSKFGYFDIFRGNVIHRRIGKNIYGYIRNHWNSDSINKYYDVTYLIDYKGIDSCKAFKSKIPSRIFLSNGKIETHYEYIFNKDICISAIIKYECFPKNNKLKYNDFFNKVTNISPEYLNYPKKDQIHLLESLRSNKYSYRGLKYGVLIDFQADTSRIPWTLNYETSQKEIKYFSEMELNP